VSQPVSMTSIDRPRGRRTLVMLGTRMCKTSRSTNWAFPLFTPDEAGGGEVSGGASRMRAVQAEYCRHCASHPELSMRVLVTGGVERDGSSRAEEAAHQLVLRYGPPGNVVETLSSGSSTLGNATATAELLLARAEQVEARTVELVTNDYHMLRSWLMFSSVMGKSSGLGDLSLSETDLARIEALLCTAASDEHTSTTISPAATRDAVIDQLGPWFAALPIRFEPLVVEDVLARCEGAPPRRYAELLRADPRVRARLPHEYRGVMDLLRGTYGRR
jgi:hypothetical protein